MLGELPFVGFEYLSNYGKRLQSFISHCINMRWRNYLSASETAPARCDEQDDEQEIQND